MNEVIEGGTQIGSSRKPRIIRYGEKNVLRLEEEFFEKYPCESYTEQWIRNHPEWTKAAAALVESLHKREVSRTQSATKKAHLVLTASFVALGVIGWIIATFLGGIFPIEVTSVSLWQGVITPIISLASASLAAVFLIYAIWWALDALKPIVFSDIKIENALRLKNKKSTNQDEKEKNLDESFDLREFCTGRIYLDWQCIYVRESLNESLLLSFSRAWHRLAFGITLLLCSWLSGLISRM